MKHPGGAGHSGAGHSAKHTRSSKHVHGKTAKHHPKGQKKAHHVTKGVKAHTVAHHPHHPRGLAVGELLPVCSLEAVAMSLRLAGQPVSDDDVAGLWEACGRRELSIAEALGAVTQFGLAGVRPRWRHPASLRDHGVDFFARPFCWRLPSGRSDEVVSTILGVDWPGPHAVLATPDGWWSWGKLWTPWTTAVSEAWEVSWL